MKPSMAVYLVSAPLVAVAARALMIAQYQDEADQLDSARYLSALADAGTRNDVGALLAMLGAALYVGAALALARIVNTRLGTIGAGLSIIGAFGLWSMSIFALVAGRLAQEQDRQVSIGVLGRIYTASVFGVFFAALIAGAAGAVLLAIALYRGRLVPRAAAVVTGVGGASLMLTAPGPAVTFVVGGAVLALIGFGWVATAASIPSESERSLADPLPR